MSTYYINPEISDAQCIGDSLPLINQNFSRLDTAVQTVSTTLVTNLFDVTDTATIDLTFNKNTRNLTAAIIDGSIGNSKLTANSITTSNINTANFTLSSTQLFGYSKGFKEFRNNLGDRGFSSAYYLNSFVSNDNRLYVAGSTSNVGIGNGAVQLVADYGFHQSMVPLAANDYITEFHTGGSDSPCMFVLTNIFRFPACCVWRSRRWI
jgi:hypothetical protein